MANCPPRHTAVARKAALLSYGVCPSERFLKNYGAPYLEKRRAYGNPDPLRFRKRTLPQELYILPERLVCAVNVREQSPWILDYVNGGFLVCHKGTGETAEVTFPLRPNFYDQPLRSGAPTKSAVTLYGGGSLGLFLYGRCSLPGMKLACQYCSIEPNRSKQEDFDLVLKEAVIVEALSNALGDTSVEISQVMLNGGNFPEMDKSFSFYTRMVRVAREAIEKSGRKDVELHLIVYPPKDLSLLGQLKGLDASVAINSEVFDPALFAKFCPGKDFTAGQKHILAALEEAVRVLGPGKVYTIVLGGLEPLESLRAGINYVADRGITPVINVFHSDPETPLADHPVATQDEILEMGLALQNVYSKHDFISPFYMHCGRNAIDTEAYLGMF